MPSITDAIKNVASKIFRFKSPTKKIFDVELTTEQLLALIEREKKDLEDVLRTKQKAIEDAYTYLNSAIEYTKAMIKIKKFLSLLIYWRPAGKFEIALWQYDIAVVTQYKRLVEAIEKLLEKKEITKKMSKQFLKRLKDDIELSNAELIEYEALQNKLGQDTHRYFRKAVGPDEGQKIAQIFLNRNAERIQRMKELVMNQRVRFPTIIEDARGILHFFKS